MQEPRLAAYDFDRLAYPTNHPLPEAHRREPREALQAQRIRRNEPAAVGHTYQASGSQRGFAPLPKHDVTSDRAPGGQCNRHLYAPEPVYRSSTYLERDVASGLA